MYFLLWKTAFIVHVYIMYLYNDYNEYIHVFHRTCYFIVHVHILQLSTTSFCTQVRCTCPQTTHCTHCVSHILVFWYIYSCIYIHTLHTLCQLYSCFEQICAYIYVYIVVHIYMYYDDPQRVSL